MSTSTVHLAARLYYLEDLSQSEIAERLGVSRSTVSRLLRRARELDIVRIVVREPDASDALAAELRESLGLRRAMVIGPTALSAVFAALAPPTMEILVSLDLRPGSILALSWGRTMWELVQSKLPPLPGLVIVPTVGAMAQHEPWFQTNEMVRSAAVATGGIPRFLHAPAMPTAKLRRSLLADGDMRETLALWDRIDVAVVGIGAPPSTLGNYGPLQVPHGDPSVRPAVGDVSSRYFDLHGDPVSHPGEDRLLAVTRKQLMTARTVIGVAAGLAKAPSIVGAARSGLIDVLVTEANTAEVALSLSGEGHPRLDGVGSHGYP